MIFYNATTNQGICQEIDSLCDSDDTSYPRLIKTRRINNAYEEIVGDIILSDGTWQFDDTSYTTLPIGTTTLVNSQQDYSFDTTMLEIERVEVLDNNGTWYKLEPIDKSKVDIALSEFYNTDGRPLFYDKNGSSIMLYPAPDNGVSVTLASGLKVYFQRTASVFTAVSTTATDTTVPGFASPYHVILAYMAAIPYCMTYKKDRVPLYQAEVTKLKRQLLKHYAQREKDTRKVMTTKRINHR